MASPASASALLAALRAPRLDVYPLPALMEAAEVVPWGAEPVRDAFPLASHRRTSPSGSEDEANLKRRGSVSSASKAGVAGRGRDASPSSGEAKESKAGEGVCVEDWFPPGFAALLRRILTCEPGHRPTVSQAMAEFDDLFQPMIVALRRALVRPPPPSPLSLFGHVHACMCLMLRGRGFGSSGPGAVPPMARMFSAKLNSRALDSPVTPVCAVWMCVAGPGAW